MVAPASRRSADEGAAPAPAPAQVPTAAASATASWWREMDAEDPISLEPLGELPYPPFELGASHERGPVAARMHEPNCWFDGRMLANYLVSTGCFMHPISRRELQLQECEALDAYLEKHALGQACVAHTFAHKEDYTLTATPHNRVARMREEATSIVAAMFSHAGGGGGGRRHGPGHHSAGGRGGRGAAALDILAGGRATQPTLAFGSPPPVCFLCSVFCVYS
jgi:hypothetical protein